MAIAAGIFRASPSVMTSVTEFEEVFRVNAFGCFHVAQQYAVSMSEGGGGAIVAVGSIAARMPGSARRPTPRRKLLCDRRCASLPWRFLAVG